MLNTKNFNYSQRYCLMHGTGTLATADTLAEVDEYRASVDDILRHFMKIGDYQNGTFINGCLYSYWRRNNGKYADCWHKW